MKLVSAVLTAWVAVALLSGCSKKGPDLCPVRGVVTYQGKPVEGAKVMFHPQGNVSRPSWGTTNANGEFKLSTFGLNDGAYPGKCIVTIHKTALPEAARNIDVKKLQEKGYAGGGMPGYGAMMGLEKGNGQDLKPKNDLPAKYADPKTSGIEVEVRADGDNEFPFNLD